MWLSPIIRTRGLGLAWRASLLVVLASASLALPPSPQAHNRGSVRAKQTTPIVRPAETRIALSSIAVSAASKPTPSEGGPTSPITTLETAGRLSGRSPSPPSPATRRAPAEGPAAATTTATITTTMRKTTKPSMTATAATAQGQAEDQTEVLEAELGGTGPGFSAPTTMLPPPTTTTTTATTTTTTPTTTTIATAGSSLAASAHGGPPNVVPIEPLSRTISPVEKPTGQPSPSRKGTTAPPIEFPTTIASISAKETRESPGKIRPQIKLTTNYTNASETGVRLPEGASAALAKPTKYHYYPHNQHIYLLPECAVQQVCNAVYVRLNFTQPLCACPGRYRDPCSASLDDDDLHTTELVTDPRTRALTLVKTCEPVAEMRECRMPRDWSLLALQNVRTGKSHYLVICRCPDANILEGPMSHDQPTYASVPGIRVYGMMCVQGTRRARPLRYLRSLLDNPTAERSESFHFEDSRTQPIFPWHKAHRLMKIANWD